MGNTTYAIGQGFAGASQGFERGLQNQAQIEQQGFSNRLALQKYAAEQEKNTKLMDFAQQDQDMKMKQYDLQIKQLQSKLNQTAIYNAFNGYLTDGDTRWFNTPLQEDENIRKLSGGVSRIDKFNIEDSGDMSLLKTSGIQEPTSEALKRFVKATYPDGSQKLLDIHGLVFASGAWKQMNDERIANTLKEAQAAYYSNKGVGGSDKTAMQKNADYLDSLDPTGKMKQDFLNKETGWAPTTATKEMNEADKARQDIISNNPKFFETTYQAGTTEYRTIEPSIQRIEKSLGIKNNSTDKKEMADIKRIITLSDKAKNLTEEDTGMLDNLVGNISKYVSDKAPAEARNAYNQMMVSVRNALFGATLPPAEMASFTSAFGSLYQQDKAVKSALKTSLEAIKSKFETYADTGDEAVTHFRYGADLAKMDQIITNLDSMIGVIDGKKSKSSNITPNIPLPDKNLDTGSDYKTPPPSFKDGQRAQNPKTGEVLVFKNGRWVAE